MLNVELFAAVALWGSSFVLVAGRMLQYGDRQNMG